MIRIFIYAQKQKHKFMMVPTEEKASSMELEYITNKMVIGIIFWIILSNICFSYIKPEYVFKK